MNAIFKYNNVYVVAPSSDPRSDVKVEEMPELICSESDKVFLYGGRIKLINRRGDCYMYIDGIKLIKVSRFNSDGSLYTSDEISLEQVVAYLNQIENLGVDTFLDNYKAQLQNLKADFESSASKLEQELETNPNDTKRSNLNNLREIIVVLTHLLFMLMVNLNAGLDNHCYIEAFDAISNLYF